MNEDSIEKNLSVLKSYSKPSGEFKDKLLESLVQQRLAPKTTNIQWFRLALAGAFSLAVGSVTLFVFLINNQILNNSQMNPTFANKYTVNKQTEDIVVDNQITSATNYSIEELYSSFTLLDSWEVVESTNTNYLISFERENEVINVLRKDVFDANFLLDKGLVKVVENEKYTIAKTGSFLEYSQRAPFNLSFEGFVVFFKNSDLIFIFQSQKDILSEVKNISETYKFDNPYASWGDSRFGQFNLKYPADWTSEIIDANTFNLKSESNVVLEVKAEDLTISSESLKDANLLGLDFKENVETKIWQYSLENKNIVIKCLENCGEIENSDEVQLILISFKVLPSAQFTSNLVQFSYLNNIYQVETLEENEEQITVKFVGSEASWKMQIAKFAGEDSEIIQPESTETESYINKQVGDFVINISYDTKLGNQILPDIEFVIQNLNSV